MGPLTVPKLTRKVVPESDFDNSVAPSSFKILSYSLFEITLRRIVFFGSGLPFSITVTVLYVLPSKTKFLLSKRSDILRGFFSIYQRLVR